MAKHPMSRLEVFIGTWNTTGDVRETPAAPAGRLVATDTYRWLPGRRFIVHDVDARFDGEPARSMEVMGYDAPRKRFASRSYDDQGATESFVLTLVRRRWTITGRTVRFDGGFDAAMSRLEGLWQVKVPRAGWRPWIDLTLVKT